MRYRAWLTAAAVYNLLWGSAAVLWPGWPFALAGVPMPDDLVFWQVVGMFVLLFAPGYWWAARDPARHGHFVLIGLTGRMLGPLGFVWAYATGQLPLAFGLVILSNDLLWLPVCALFVRDAARAAGGWRYFLAGA